MNSQEGSGPSRRTSPSAALRTQRRERRMAELMSFKTHLQKTGFRRRFIDEKMHDDNGRLIEDERTSDVVKWYAEMWVGDAAKAHPHTDLKTILYHAGFTKRIASHISGVLAPLADSSYSRDQLLGIAIEYAQGIYDRLTPVGQRFFVCQDVVDAWVPHETYQSVYNSSTRSLPPHVVEHCVQPSSKIYFHATNWKSLDSITKLGINHYKGRPCLDFGLDPSFYMTPDLSTAVEWCEKNMARWKGEACILMFAVPNRRGAKHKVFKDATKEWVDLVTHARTCDPQTPNELDTYDSVYGPMAVNPNGIAHMREKARVHATPKYQLASKSRTSDAFLTRCYKGVVFL